MSYAKGTALVALALLLGIVVLACGPAAPSRAPITQAEPTEQPTKTPLPPEYIKPTDLPTSTPFPTLPPDPVYPEGASSEPDPPSLTEQVTEFVERETGNFDAVAKIRVLSRKELTVPKTKWPKNQDPHWGDHTWLRSRIELLETVHGEAPQNFEIAVASLWPNAALEVNREYIVFLHHQYVTPRDFPGDPTRFHFKKKQMKAFGGPAYIFFGEQTWLVDGEQARRIPVEHLQERTKSSDLAAARAGGQSLDLDELLSTISDAIEN